MNDFPNVSCAFLMTSDNAIKQSSHGLKFTVKILGFSWGDALCKIQANNKHMAVSRNRRVMYFFFQGVFYKTGGERHKLAVKNSWCGASAWLGHDKLPDL